jgi:hypothetical protein
MAIKHKLGKVQFNDSDEEITVNFSNSYSRTPVIKITNNQNFNIFLKDVTNSSFKIAKSELGQSEVHYIIIER